MTTSEFSYEFDVLYNNVTSNQAPGLNGYEKSVFLTKAEKQLVQEYYNQRTDVQGGGVDGSPKRQVDLSNLIESAALEPATAAQISQGGLVPTNKESLVFSRVSILNAVSILNEALFVNVTAPGDIELLKKDYTIVPISYEEYQRLMMKPYKYPPKGQAWRLFTKNFVEIIGRDLDLVVAIQRTQTAVPSGFAMYHVRYVRTPHPIIVESLSGLGVSIDGETSVTECELPDEMHHEILERAVALAKIAWQGATMTQVAAAQK